MTDPPAPDEPGPSDGQAPPAPGSVDRNRVRHVQQHELDAAERMADLGYHVVFLPCSPGQGRRTPDWLVNGRTWELKSPTGAGAATIIQMLRRAQCPRVVIDTCRTQLTMMDALTQVDVAFRRYPRLEAVLLIDEAGAYGRRRE